MEQQIKTIELNGKDLEGLPLFFRKIFYNRITDMADERKLIKYSREFQCDLIRDNFPVRQISKTINYKLFKSITDAK